MTEPPDVDAIVKKIEISLAELGEADPQLRDRTDDVVRLLMQLYGAGLARLMQVVGPEAAERIAEDRLLASLLLLHGLHPVDAGTRIRDALRRLERKLDGHHLQLAELSEGVVHIRVERNGGHPPPALAGAIERAIAECAPDVSGVEIEGLPDAATGLVQIALSASNNQPVNR